MALNSKQMRFVEEYCVDMNATQAALRSGYSQKTAYSQGQRLLKHAEVAAAIDKKREALTEKTDDLALQAVRELARIGLVDPRNLFDSDGNPLPITALDDATAAAIQGIDVVTTGNADTGVGVITKIRFCDKNSALDKILKHLGLYERDNKQRIDPVAEVLRAVDGKTKGLDGR